MHQSDLYLPVPAITTARHSAPARLPAASPTPTWPQSLSSSPVPKKRNVERACDDCRRRKTRCDGPKMPDNVCTNCVQNRKICTYMLAQTFFFTNNVSTLIHVHPYSEASKPRGPPKAFVTPDRLSFSSTRCSHVSYSYVTRLEDRVEKMEALLKRVRTPFELKNLCSVCSVRVLCARDPPIFRKNRR